MHLNPNNRTLPEATTVANFDPIIGEFIDDLLARVGIAQTQVGCHRSTARHFLIWLGLSGIALETVDCTVIERFLRHRCECRATVQGPASLPRRHKRRTSPPLMNFVCFLERTGRIETPGDMEGNFRLLDTYLERMRVDGYASATITMHRSGCAGLIVWLHFARIRLRDLTVDAYARFRNREFICSIPGVFYGQRVCVPGGCYERQIRKFLGYLVAIGRIEPLEPAPQKSALPVIVQRFSAWLERHRGIRQRSIRQHVRLVAAVLSGLGDDPEAYDAALIRRVLLEHIERRSVSQAKHLATTMRMYLRFLAAESKVTAALVGAVPTVRQWRLSGLPRYIPAEDVERAIESCGDDPVGVRDRAILLLLARLALRAGDVVGLRLRDIDWDKAQIRVSGKSRRQSILPLPQDAGDALHTYVATVRPRIDEQKVFLCANAPHRAFIGSSNVSAVAKSALDRAGITTRANRGRGAHVFRHSRATQLLRSGATLEVIQTLLRHASPRSTAIYAKTDTVMLQEVAQPWIGGMKQ